MAQDAEHAVRGRYDVSRWDDARHLRQIGTRGVGIRDRDVDHAQVAVARDARRGECVIAGVDEEALDEGAEGRRDGALVAGRDLHRVAEKTAHPVAAARRELRRGVLDLEGPAESGGLRRERLALALGGVQLLAQ